ncbi:MAG: hypothetical protein VB101_01110 [Rhodospirillaceae bacterium]|nr:hypothetical protein [Rhodospirillaceae bacterium]
MTSFSEKRIEVHITLAQGRFSGGGNTKVIRGLGVDCAVDKPGLPAKNGCKLAIKGIGLDDMEQATTLAFRPLKVEPNKIAVYAGDDAGGMALAFSGDIVSAWPDFNAAPDVAFRIEAITGYVASVTPQSPTTRSGAAPIEQLMSLLAQDIGVSFRNNGVSGSLLNPALYGGPLEKAQAIARQGNFELILDDAEMVIQPFSAVRAAAPTVWSKETGLLGYPTFTKEGISARGLYAPGLVQGGVVEIETIVPKAAGRWKITSLRHSLQASYPGASKWETAVEAAYAG